MANTTVSVTIAEGDVARVKKALMGFTDLGASATAKQLAAAAIRRIVAQQERQENTITEPNIE